MSKRDFTKSYDEVLFVYSVLKRLGCGNMNTFEKRLKSQKMQYLAQLFGIVPVYSYNLYIYGPYSPNLASDLFLITEKDIKPNIGKFLPEELEIRFNELNKFIKDLDNRKLELVATIHWLSFKAKLSMSKAINKLKKLKNPSEKELITTKLYLKKLCQLLKK